MPTGQRRKTKVVDGIQYNQCTKCGEWFEATREFFAFRSDYQVLLAKCRICMSKDGLTRSQQKSAREKQKEYREKNKKKVNKATKEWRKNNEEHMKKYDEENKEKKSMQKREHYQKNKERCRKLGKEFSKSNAKFKTYKDKLTVDEDPIASENGNLLVKCTYCGRYYCPTAKSVINRISVVKGGPNLHGEARLYCSDGCKEACPTFGQQLYPKGFKPATSREVNPLIRQMCLERDDYTCQKCGATIEEIELHCHHIEGATQMPMLANDVENTITLCKPCHILVHQQDGCTNYDLRCKK